MTDIVERLRTAYLTGPDRDVLTEAAAEIERHMREKVALAALVSKERNDNERLRAALEFYANPETYLKRHGLAIEFDDGEKARRALEPKP